MSALQDKKLKVGSLFAGIGGFDYGLELAGGFQIEWQIEIDPFCQQVLAKHWPNATRYGDIRECGIGRKYILSHIDVLCGGFPCQPHSLAGQRKASEDERDLWSEFYRLIRELKPRWVVAENVRGLLSSEDGAFFGNVLRDLAGCGYDAEWRVLCASDIGAPHERERVFIVAYPSSKGQQTSRPWQQTITSLKRSQNIFHFLDTWLSQSRVGGNVYGLPSQLDRHRWPAGQRYEQYTYEPVRTTSERIPHRKDRLKALGNSIVPQLPALIGKAIVEHEIDSEGVA